jgi:hypothetical protein
MTERKRSRSDFQGRFDLLVGISTLKLDEMQISNKIVQ